jgi:uncharacterized membrane protein YbhN (UPF0104 family)
MGGEGAISGMISSLRDNRNLLAKNRQKHREAFEKLKEKVSSNIKISDPKKISKADLELFRKEMKKEKRQETLKLIVISAFFGIAAIVMIYLILLYL